jgi:hypothetical protein
MTFDSLISFLARWRLRYNNGTLFTGVLIQIASLEAFAKIWADTFSFYGIPPLAAYIGLPVIYFVTTGGVGYAYEYVRWWEKEISHQNLNVNPEVVRLLANGDKGNEKLDRILKLLEKQS